MDGGARVEAGGLLGSWLSVTQMRNGTGEEEVEGSDFDIFADHLDMERERK